MRYTISYHRSRCNYRSPNCPTSS